MTCNHQPTGGFFTLSWDPQHRGGFTSFGASKYMAIRAALEVRSLEPGCRLAMKKEDNDGTMVE